MAALQGTPRHGRVAQELQGLREKVTCGGARLQRWPTRADISASCCLFRAAKSAFPSDAAVQQALADAMRRRACCRGIGCKDGLQAAGNPLLLTVKVMGVQVEYLDTAVSGLMSSRMGSLEDQVRELSRRREHAKCPDQVQSVKGLLISGNTLTSHFRMHCLFSLLRPCEGKLRAGPPCVV